MEALLLEIRLGIGVIQAYIDVQERTTVKIYKNKIEIADSDGVTRDCTFAHFTVQPNSCKNLKHVPGEGLHFRMALGEERLTKCNSDDDDDDDEDRDSQLLLSDHVSFYCATCGHCITKAVK